MRGPDTFIHAAFTGCPFCLFPVRQRLASAVDRRPARPARASSTAHEFPSGLIFPLLGAFVRRAWASMFAHLVHAPQALEACFHPRASKSARHAQWAHPAEECFRCTRNCRPWHLKLFAQALVPRRSDPANYIWSAVTAAIARNVKWYRRVIVKF